MCERDDFQHLKALPEEIFYLIMRRNAEEEREYWSEEAQCFMPLCRATCFSFEEDAEASYAILPSNIGCTIVPVLMKLLA